MYNQIDSNKRRTVLLIGLFLIFVIGVGWVFAQVYNSPIILVVAVIFSLVQALISYYYSDKIALFTAGAREAKESDFHQLHNLVENLAITAGLPKPKIYVIGDPSPNAFATGRDPNHAVIAVTTGLLEKLDKKELEGVIAHELSHVGNYDIRLMTVVVVLVGSIALLSHWFMRSLWFRGRDDRENGNILMIVGIVFAILAPVAATLIQLAISRKREYLADASGALLTRYPEGLADALEIIANDKQPLQDANQATAHLYISNPFKGKNISNLFSTHPPIEDRIKKLRAMDI